MSRDDAPCKCNGTGFISDPIIGNLICDCTFRKAGLGGDQSDRPEYCPLVPVKHTAIAPGNKKVWVEE